MLMLKMSMVKRALVVGTATTAATLALAVAPAAAGDGPPQTGSESATLTVIKEVDGTAPADATFTIRVSCDVIGDTDMTFGPEGGSDSVTFFRPDECEITEPGNGGASSTTGLGTVRIEDPTAYSQTVVNVFDPDVPTTPTSAAVAAAADTATRPTFTG